MSETTHLICAHCGGDSPVSNKPGGNWNNVIRMAGEYVEFTCSLCDCQYPLIDFSPAADDKSGPSVTQPGSPPPLRPGERSR